jgi:hypothetical protein
MNNPFIDFNNRFNGKVKQLREESPIEISHLVNLTHAVLKASAGNRDVYEADENNLPFEVLYVVSEDDLKFIDQNIDQMDTLYGKQIVRYKIITPKLRSSDYRFLENKKVAIELDEEYFIENLHQDTFAKFSKDRHLWLLQQYLKTKYVYNAMNPVLILDADTFLVRKINWINERTHTFLLNEHDFHYPYNRHFERFTKMKGPLLNFVSHTQVQLPDIVRKIYGEDFESGWVRWLITGYSRGENSPVSEYQTYGAYLASTSPQSCVFVFPEHNLIFNNQLGERSIASYLLNCHSDLITFGNKKEIVI